VNGKGRVNGSGGDGGEGSFGGPPIGQGRVSVASSVLCLQQDRQNYPQAKRFRSHPAHSPA
jgi:hypothetical protein